MDRVFEFLEIGVGGGPGDGCGYGEGDDDKPCEFLAKEPADLADTGPEHFADSDLFCFAEGHKGYENIEAEAADEDGDAGEDLYEGKEDVIHDVEFGDAFVEEGVGVDVIGVGIVPSGFDALHGLAVLMGSELH